MKYAKLLSIIFALTLVLSSCGNSSDSPDAESSLQSSAVTDTAVQESETSEIPKAPETPTYENAREIVLSDDIVTVDGVVAGTDTSSSVYTANDIVFYESGKDFTYGEGTEKDSHSAEEAAAHTVVHITEKGTYSVSGKLSRGQIAIDLGNDAEDDPEAVVTLVLNGVEITCDVAPAVIFYNVYECGSDDADAATKDVDTSAAGANVIIADGTVNTVNGSYVARIYKPGSVVLDDNNEIVDSKKLHKYDGAFYSKMSMNIYGDDGALNITAANEGLDSEMHLAINGGVISIKSGNDGINTNEDGISVTTVNGGTLTITVTGDTGEGDGIDSNGWLVINGGTVTAAACSDSADAGIDSDMGIHINGGTVMATGHMLDRIEDGGQTYAVFNFREKQDGIKAVTFKNNSDDTVFESSPGNMYSILIYSAPDLTAGTYSLWCDGKQMAGQGGGMMGGHGGHGMKPDDGERPERPEGFETFEGEMPPEGFETFESEIPPEGFEPIKGEKPQMDGMSPDGRPERPEGERPDGEMGGIPAGEMSPDFNIQDGANMFSGISYLE